MSEPSEILSQSANIVVETSSTGLPDPRLRLQENMRRRTIPGIDGIRGISALTVVALHGTSSHFPGRQAVQMFFVLSGLLVTWLLLAEEKRNGTVSLSGFYWRRAFRLFPPLIALLVWEMATDLPHVSSAAVLAAALYYANYFAAAGGDLLGLLHTWSLSVKNISTLYGRWPSFCCAIANGWCAPCSGSR
jgi:peptidoglycan/LPS O-acetylase OafA/YrhL